MLRLPRLRARVGKSGSVRYYYDAGGKPRRWIPLGAHEPTVERRYRELRDKTAPLPGTVDAMLADAIADLRPNVTPGTLRNYESFRKHLAAVFERPDQVTQADVIRYLRICPRMSFRGEIALLSQAFTLWVERGLVDVNPCFGVRIKREGSRRTRLLAPAEIDRILEHADERLAVAVELGYATGLRIGDLCRLRWADLDGTFRTQKTGALATIGASDVLTPILARARALQARVASLYVLCGRGGRQWKPDSLRDYWTKACKAASVDDAHFHDLRAAAATAIEREHGVAAAQNFLTHRYQSTTSVYLRDRRATVVTPLRRKAS
jgi:integrase